MMRIELTPTSPPNPRSQQKTGSCLLNYRRAILITLVILAACDPTFPTPTPLPPLTGPTLPASPTIFPRQPTDIPFDIPYDGYYEGSNDPTAAALAPGEALPPLHVGTPAPRDSGQTVAITAQDGAQLAGMLYQSLDGVRLPGVLLLSPKVADWGAFPRKLYAAGFTVLAMDLREQGLLDFQVMLRALSSGEADPASLAVIGAGAGADITLLGCAGDLLCDTAILLSPSSNPALIDALNAFTPRPILLAASQDDPDSFGSAQKLQAAARGEVLFQRFDSAGHGALMLFNRPDLGDLVIDWLERQIG
jgi:hypothetical protein